MPAVKGKARSYMHPDDDTYTIVHILLTHTYIHTKD